MQLLVLRMARKSADLASPRRHVSIDRLLGHRFWSSECGQKWTSSLASLTPLRPRAKMALGAFREEADAGAERQRGPGAGRRGATRLGVPQVDPRDWALRAGMGPRVLAPGLGVPQREPRISRRVVLLTSARRGEAGGGRPGESTARGERGRRGQPSRTSAGIEGGDVHAQTAEERRVHHRHGGRGSGWRSRRSAAGRKMTAPEAKLGDSGQDRWSLLAALP